MDTEKIIRELLPQVIHMSLSTVLNNKPWVTELHFAFDDNLNLYFRSLKTRRHGQEIAANPNVAGTVVIPCTPGQGCNGAVYFEGTAKLLPAGTEQDQAFEVLKQRFDLDKSKLEEAQRDDGHQFYKISVSNWAIFGDYKNEGAQKYELTWGKA